MEIALNKESKRKTPAAISFRDGERSFGEDAMTTGIRFPAGSYVYLLDLLGKKVDNPIVGLFSKRFPYYNIEADPERGTVLFRYDDETVYSVEELMAQLLSYARDIAAGHTNQKIKDCVLTVPPFFNQAERRAVLDSADLAGLKVLSLMSSNAAVALNYGMFRRKEINETVQNILFFDMGASSTTATVASYQTVKTKEKGYTETNPQVTILGVGYDRSLGGLEMQLRLRDFLAKKFTEVKKTSNSVYDSPRAMAKLLKEAGRLKKVLSANTDHLSQIEGVLDEEDFKLPVTREEFESLCTDVFERVTAPVDAALISAGMDISAIDQFIIVGGSTRIPRVQSLLQEVWGRELGKNINADEAAAMGAVYRAADLGQGFKVKKFHVKEAVIFPIEVDFERQIENDDGSSSVKTVKRSLFALNNNYPQKKVMTFNKHTADFNFFVNYGDLSHLPKNEKLAANANNISFIEVSGVTSAFQKHQQEGSESKGIKAHFNMDDFGVLTLGAMETVFEKSMLVEDDKPKEEESTLSKLGSTISKLFSGSEDEKSEDKDKENKTGEDVEKKSKGGKEETDQKKENGKKEEKNTEEAGKDAEKELKPKLVTVKEELNFTIKYLDIPSPSPEAFKASKKKIADINAAEKARHEKAAARNNLESYILEAQEKLWQEEYEKASTAEQRTTVREMCSQLDEWIYDEGFEEEASVYKEKLSTLRKLFEPIRERVLEHQDRPEAMQALQDMINGSSLFLQKAREAPLELQLFTDVEMTTMDALIIETQKWLEEKEELQENTPLYETPKLLLADIAEKMASLDREIKYLVNKGKIVKAKKDREAAEAKAKAEKEAKEAEKEKSKKKNTTTNGEKDSLKESGEQQPADKDTNAEENQIYDDKTVENETRESDGKNDAQSNAFQENSEENDSEGDKRKGQSENIDANDKDDKIEGTHTEL
ncbi:Hypoxia up-regulated protein 1 [Halocaridina rubra]|uniref:Hypoxia up-regulated protein 1 n=1 Tax=Halocaridina rubra TaxID=373956 RepID=A0AAN8WQL9_HALRR